MERKEKNRFKLSKLPVTKTQAACAAGGVILYAVMSAINEGRGDLSQEGLKRAGPGNGETSYELSVSGFHQKEGTGEITVDLPVRERRYREQEARELLQKLGEELKVQILGENESLEEVRTDLNLKTGLSGYGFKISWESENPELVDSFGIVHNEDVSEAGEPVWLGAWLTDGTHERRYEYKVVVYPPVLTPEEQLAAAFKKWVDKADVSQQTEDRLLLPAVYDGQTLTYSLVKDEDYRFLPIIGILLAALLHAKKEMDKQKQAKEREQQLLFDYSEVVSKLVVYVGAGLTVRGALERMAAGYEESLSAGKKRGRPAYEEVVKTVRQLGSGLGEGKAYGEFGRRCGLQSYLKLSALLEQSQKNGSRQLRPALELELVSAFEQRKNLAKKLGEEAGTKLLLPLLLMLGVVMVMIVVPAFLAFY
ncbi:MAG: hypothetical protein QM657_13805 [Lacrimispora sp.]|uniref:immunoglobulin-like domain-containing protein n=1 Tax=Lacrimispora sp. TaxID=2719234 RepID=UPI0039E4BE72